MGITLSVATSADGYIDDNSDQRLTLSTPEDWKEVYALRSMADAIVIGAQTLRRDNPRLSLKSDNLRQKRISSGFTPEPHKVIISGRGEIDPSLRLFESPYKNIIIFSNIPRPELEPYTEVIVAENISAELVVTELEKRGLTKIFVEGGSKVLNLFFEAGCVDVLRLATNPVIRVNDPLAPKFNRPPCLDNLKSDLSCLGGMRVEIFTFKDRAQRRVDVEFMNRAINLSQKCTPSSTSYCVGAVVRTAKGEIFEGYTHETSPTHHAEQEAILKAERAGANLDGATIYSSMEPCSERSSEPESCSEIIIRHKFSRAIFALYEPSCFVNCHGALNMRLAGIEVRCLDELAEQVRAVNAHLDF